jgi:hypothetical protein
MRLDHVFPCNDQYSRLVRLPVLRVGLKHKHRLLGRVVAHFPGVSDNFCSGLVCSASVRFPAVTNRSAEVSSVLSSSICRFFVSEGIRSLFSLARSDGTIITTVTWPRRATPPAMVVGTGPPDSVGQSQFRVCLDVGAGRAGMTSLGRQTSSVSGSLYACERSDLIMGVLQMHLKLREH